MRCREVIVDSVKSRGTPRRNTIDGSARRFQEERPFQILSQKEPGLGFQSVKLLMAFSEKERTCRLDRKKAETLILGEGRRMDFSGPVTVQRASSEVVVIDSTLSRLPFAKGCFLSALEGAV